MKLSDSVKTALILPLLFLNTAPLNAETNPSSWVAPVSQVVGTSSQAKVTSIIGEAKYAKKVKRNGIF